MDKVSFDSLLGEHILTGVDSSNEKIKIEWGDSFEDCGVTNFILDGITYAAIENPDDGYRSSMRDLQTTDHVVKNVFPQVRVLCKVKDNGRHPSNDILQMLSLETGKLVLEVGTGNCDDYYPYYVANFHPENMPVNQVLEK